MTPTDFEFTMTMPGDARLVGAVRQLAAQAAGYAQLEAETSERLAEHVEGAIAAMVSATALPDAPMHLRFAGDGQTLDVVISSDEAGAGALPQSTTSGGVTIEWTRDGSRQTCHIRQPIPA